MMASFEAASECTLLRLRRPEFMTVMMRYPDIAAKLDAAGHEVFSTLSPTSRKRDEDHMRSTGLTTEERERLDKACAFIESVPMFHGLAEPKFLFELARLLTPSSFPVRFLNSYSYG